jgi:hypothetical protein
METIKIQVSEVEGMTLKIPTEFTSDTYDQFYNQMLAISKTLPTASLVFGEEKFKGRGKTKNIAKRMRIGVWQNKEECLALLQMWETRGKEKTIEWIEEIKGWELEPIEKSNVSNLVAAVRSKYKGDLVWEKK